MIKIKRYYCGNGEGMFEDKKGHWIYYEDHINIIKEKTNQFKKLSRETWIAVNRNDDGWLQWWNNRNRLNLNKLYNNGKHKTKTKRTQ